MTGKSGELSWANTPAGKETNPAAHNPMKRVPITVAIQPHPDQL
ncbi:hypothetical protein HP15_3983 [Marinobacter adhaerens HP15]|jgi:hypothetical protein|uniref:Uncharacterized protein n=1 Tax=Marinobacter adhaerens (strain DSM 23420 / HP15) TaxID=225937 RepID=E4PKS5_MARAH|nr:hypothetical protein HP15_3983 [Marinobacter adhaerens HP15]